VVCIPVLMENQRSALQQLPFQAWYLLDLPGPCSGICLLDVPGLGMAAAAAVVSDAAIMKEKFYMMDSN
jgi:hypothetical protein